MACKNRCGNTSVADEYKCASCLIKDNDFKWCVITWVPPEHEDGNKYDTTIPNKRCKYGVQHIQLPVFMQGEIFPVDPSFWRELTGDNRKPGKWDVEAEYFAAEDYKKAILRACKASRDSYLPKDNLEYLKHKYEQKHHAPK